MVIAVYSDGTKLQNVRLAVGKKRGVFFFGTDLNKKTPTKLYFCILFGLVHCYIGPTYPYISPSAAGMRYNGNRLVTDGNRNNSTAWAMAKWTGIPRHEMTRMSTIRHPRAR